MLRRRRSAQSPTKVQLNATKFDARSSSSVSITNSPPEMSEDDPTSTASNPNVSPYPSPRPSPIAETRTPMDDEPRKTPPPVSPRRRRFSSASQSTFHPRVSRSQSTSSRIGARKKAAEPSSSTLPLLLTFLVPLASFATGGDLLKDVVLLLFLVFYLHQLIKGVF